MDSQPDFSFNLELTRNQQEQYGMQFTESEAEPTVSPPVTIVGVDALEIHLFLGLVLCSFTLFWLFSEHNEPWKDEEEAMPQPIPPPVVKAPPPVELPGAGDCGLGVAQIVITAATPMVEEASLPFPGAEPPQVDDEDEESSLSEQTAVCVRQPASSSTGSEGDSTGPHSPPAAPRAGRASIPDELEPAQLARLTDLKESNA